MTHPSSSVGPTCIGRTREEWHQHIDMLFGITLNGEDIPEATLIHAWPGTATEADREWANKQIAELGAPGEQRGANYVANRECRPTEVRFDNGRRVYIKQDADGPFLEVEMMKPGEAWLRNVADAEDGVLTVAVQIRAISDSIIATIDPPISPDKEGQ